MDRRMSAAAPPPQPVYQQAPPPAPAPAPAPAAAAPAAPAYVAELEQLAALRDAGVLTDEEFEAKKRKILGL
jgi:hypothetical protein